MNRRHFLLSAAASGAAMAAPDRPARPALCLFSKHVPNLTYDEVGRTLKLMGFDGVDLTVRAEGHVLPERAAQDLPRAVETIRSYGLALPMITTNLLSASEPVARPILSTAAKLKVPFFKLGYHRYRPGVPVEKAVAEVKAATEGLVALGREYGIVAGFHNHSGNYVGTAVWDIREILKDSDPEWIGYYFDPAHATAEGGLYGWQLSLQLALRRLNMVAIKDFYWEKRGGRWQMTWCPLGEGMVDWPKVFAAFAAARFTGPMSLHIEYHAKDELSAIANDLAFMKKQVEIAYGA